MHAHTNSVCEALQLCPCDHSHDFPSGNHLAICESGVHHTDGVNSLSPLAGLSGYIMVVKKNLAKVQD